MPRTKKPREGSLQFWPRKRAKRIYPRTSHWATSKDVKPLGFAGWKAGMTHIQYIDNTAGSPSHGKTISKSVTILDTAPLLVCAVKFYKNNLCVGEQWTEKIPAGVEKRIKKGKRKGKIPEKFDNVRIVVSTQPEKSGMRKKKADVFELGIGGPEDKRKDYALSLLGKEIKPEDVFAPGEYVDISAVTKGKGFTGPVKRYGIKIQTRKNEQHHRHVGSIGSVTPRKVDWRVPAAGQHGYHVRTEAMKRVIMMSDDVKAVTPKGGFLGYGNPKSFMLVEGSVPGPRKRLIRLRKTVKGKVVAPIDIKYISIESKQGK